MLTEHGLPSPARPPVSVLQQRDSASPPSPRPPPGPGSASPDRPLCGRPQAAPVHPREVLGSLGRGRGEAGEAARGWRLAAEGSVASPRSLPARQRPRGPGPSAGPSRGETRQRRKERGRRRGASPLVGRLPWDPAGLPARGVTTPRPRTLRGQLAPRGLYAGGRRTGGSDLWSPKWSRL